MKTANLSKVLGLSVLSLSLAVLPVINSASAQDTPAAPSGTTTTTPTTDVDNDNDSNWGWLGLLGLAGLAGLAGRKRHDEPVRYQDPTVAPSRSDYR
ncbi:MAG: WGxxGxxG-CTERM domain-containing protein [Oscillatoriales cyanobacterium C42_A2020_001]|nr:WGxxGxxG-CTERM domain-containing protein [Leptolyngbyaceae cyanobacterium C42_A2020_001]